MMTLHKFTVYMYGLNDNKRSTILRAISVLENPKAKDYVVYPYHERSTKVEDIEGTHPLRRPIVERKTWEKYLDNKLVKLLEAKAKADEELEAYKKKKGL